MLEKKQEGQSKATKASQPKYRGGDCSLVQPKAGVTWQVECPVLCFPVDLKAPLPLAQNPPHAPFPMGLGITRHSCSVRVNPSGFLLEGGLAAFMNSQLNPSQSPVQWNSWLRILTARREVISLMGVPLNNK